MSKAKSKPRRGKSTARRSKSGNGWVFVQLIILGALIFGAIQYKDRLPVSVKRWFTLSTYAPERGTPIDQLNGVYVYYNGSTGNSTGRSVAACGYNLGQKYQCVEFVKRYYYEHLGHKMPNPYGHAKDYFNRNLRDGQVNRDRNLMQYTNPSIKKPQVDDLIVFGATAGNPYGHVAIVSKVNRKSLEIIHQNSGNGNSTRMKYDLEHEDGKWKIVSARAVGWLRKES